MKKYISYFALLLFFVFTVDANSAQQTLYAAQNGSGSTCSAESPCTYSTALSTVAGGDNDIIYLYGPNEGHGTGIYSTANLTDTANHDNLTISATPSVQSSLGTFTKGIPSGTDNRPQLQGTMRIYSGITGVSLQYLRIRGSASPVNNNDGAVRIDSENFTAEYVELWNGYSGFYFYVKRYGLINQCYIHDLGSNPSESLDTHGVAIVGAGTEATTWAEGIYVTNSTIEDVSGDGVQEATSCYGTGSFSYLTVSGNTIRRCEEQAMDNKGTRHVKFHDNDVSDNGYGNHAYGSIVTTGDLGGECTPDTMTDWQIYNNHFHDESNYVLSWNGSFARCNTFLIYNNIIEDVCTDPEFNWPALYLCGDSNTYVVGNIFLRVNDNGGQSTDAIRTNGGGRIYNNIFLDNEDDINGSFTAASNNYFYNSGGSFGSNPVTTCYEAGNCAGFTDINGGDYSLLGASPCVDQGYTLSSPYNVDILGNSRPESGGSTFDIGAYEYGAEEAGDSISPVITVDQSSPQNITSDSLSITGNATDAAGTVASVKFRIGSEPDGSNGTACTANDGTFDEASEDFTCSVSGFSEGANTLYIECDDDSGNWSTGNSITVNYTPQTVKSNVSVGAVIDLGGGVIAIE